MTPGLPLLLVAALTCSSEGPRDEGLWLACAEGALRCYDPQPGDIVLYRHDHRIPNFASRPVGSGGLTHAALVVALPGGRPVLLEVAGPGRCVKLVEVGPALREFDGFLWVRRRRVPLSAEQLGRLTAFACAQVGKGFDLVGAL